MKKIIYIFLVLFLVAAVTSCDHEDLLKEEAKDFLSPDNSYTNKEGFEAALGYIHEGIRAGHIVPRSDRAQNYAILGGDADVSVWQKTDVDTYNEYFHWNTFNGDHDFVTRWWPRFYKWIYHSNVIIDRAESDVVSWVNDEEKNAIVGEAKFLRAWAYHFLANIWGGVPLVLNETKSADYDYTRASQEEIYRQCKEDLTFATQWMNKADATKGGRAPRAAAYHLLTEINIQLGDYQGAIAAASAVINDPAYELMTERFGRYKDMTWNGYDFSGAQEPWGDVYFDLFRNGNFNRAEGNKEAIWVAQVDAEIQGGGFQWAIEGMNNMERWCAGGAAWAAKDVNGVSNWMMDTLSGRSVGTYVANEYLENMVWNYKDDFNRDIRNSKYNIQRTHYWTNPASDFYGQPMTSDNTSSANFKPNFVGIAWKKVPTVEHAGKSIINGQRIDWGRTDKDWYLIRLAETYLLRAEAYLGAGDTQSAANDINAIRTRSEATPVTAGDVDLDLILDERARELYLEEFRISTLCRTNKLVEYVMKYNEAVIFNGYSLDNHLNKFPIPNIEIELNKEGILEQNPGYN